MKTGHRCLLCSSCAEPFLTSAGKRYFFCPECELISLDCTFHVSGEEARLRYLQHNNSRSNTGYTVMLQELVDYILEHRISGGREVLDFGCGPEPVLPELLEERGFSVSMYDSIFFSEECYRDKKYDIIILNEVIEHLVSPLSELLKLRPLLSKDACIAVSSLLHPQTLEDFRGWWYKDDVTHVSFFSLNTVGVLAGRLNMKHLHCDGRNRWLLA